MGWPVAILLTPDAVLRCSLQPGCACEQQHLQPHAGLLLSRSDMACSSTTGVLVRPGNRGLCGPTDMPTGFLDPEGTFIAEELPHCEAHVKCAAHVHAFRSATCCQC